MSERSRMGQRTEGQFAAFHQAVEDDTVGKDVQIIGRNRRLKITGFASIRNLVPKFIEKVYAEYFIRHDPSGSGRKWLMRFDGQPVENMSVERFEKAVEAKSKRK